MGKIIKDTVKTGRKLKYQSVELMQSRIDEYFNLIQDHEDVPTVAGLALHLGFVARSTLKDYQERPRFSAVVKRALTRIERELERRLYSGKPPIGLIFGLKNNFGWQDKHDVDLTSAGQKLGVVALPANPDTSKGK